MRRAWEVLQRVVPESLLEAAVVMRAWQEVARREGLAAEAEFRAGRLVLRASTSAQAQEIALRCAQIQTKVNEHAGKALVREIRVRTTGG